MCTAVSRRHVAVSLQMLQGRGDLPPRRLRPGFRSSLRLPVHEPLYAPSIVASSTSKLSFPGP